MSDSEDNGSNVSFNQTIAEDMAQEVEDMYPELDDMESDVVFVVNGHRIPALKAIFAFKSRVFRAMFGEPFAESTASEIPIDDPMITVDAFQAMRRYIYTDEVMVSDGHDLDELNDVMRCGHKYQVLRLVNKVADKMAAMMTFDNVKTIVEMANKYDVKPLKNSVNAFIMESPYLLVNYKDINYLKTLDQITGGKLFEAMAKSMVKTYNYFDKSDQSFDFDFYHMSNN